MRLVFSSAPALLFAAAMLVSGHGHGHGQAQRLVTDARGSSELLRADTPRSPSRGRSNNTRTNTLIACTRTGCRPVPPACWIEIERDWDGLPTGYDAVICPVR
jgi:hypothetical protein